MARKIQVTIDDETLRLLKALAAPRAGNRSFVIREAVRRMADQEGFERYLDWLEQQPGIGMSVDRALSDEQGGRTVRHDQMRRRIRASRSR